MYEFRRLFTCTDTGSHVRSVNCKNDMEHLHDDEGQMRNNTGSRKGVIPIHVYNTGPYDNLKEKDETWENVSY